MFIWFVIEIVFGADEEIFYEIETTFDQKMIEEFVCKKLEYDVIEVSVTRFVQSSNYIDNLLIALNEQEIDAESIQMAFYYIIKHQLDIVTTKFSCYVKLNDYFLNKISKETKKCADSIYFKANKTTLFQIVRGFFLKDDNLDQFIDMCTKLLFEIFFVGKDPVLKTNDIFLLYISDIWDQKAKISLKNSHLKPRVNEKNILMNLNDILNDTEHDQEKCKTKLIITSLHMHIFYYLFKTIDFRKITYFCENSDDFQIFSAIINHFRELRQSYEIIKNQKDGRNYKIAQNDVLMIEIQPHSTSFDTNHPHAKFINSLIFLFYEIFQNGNSIKYQDINETLFSKSLHYKNKSKGFLKHLLAKIWNVEKKNHIVLEHRKHNKYEVFTLLNNINTTFFEKESLAWKLLNSDSTPICKLFDCNMPDLCDHSVFKFYNFINPHKQIKILGRFIFSKSITRAASVFDLSFLIRCVSIHKSRLMDEETSSKDITLNEIITAELIRNGPDTHKKSLTEITDNLKKVLCILPIEVASIFEMFDILWKKMDLDLIKIFSEEKRCVLVNQISQRSVRLWIDFLLSSEEDGNELIIKYKKLNYTVKNLLEAHEQGAGSATNEFKENKIDIRPKKDMQSTLYDSGIKNQQSINTLHDSDIINGEIPDSKSIFFTQEPESKEQIKNKLSQALSGQIKGEDVMFYFTVDLSNESSASDSENSFEISSISKNTRADSYDLSESRSKLGFDQNYDNFIAKSTSSKNLTQDKIKTTPNTLQVESFNPLKEHQKTQPTNSFKNTLSTKNPPAYYLDKNSKKTGSVSRRIDSIYDFLHKSARSTDLEISSKIKNSKGANKTPVRSFQFNLPNGHEKSAQKFQKSELDNKHTQFATLKSLECTKNHQTNQNVLFLKKNQKLTSDNLLKNDSDIKQENISAKTPNNSIKRDNIAINKLYKHFLAEKTIENMNETDKDSKGNLESRLFKKESFQDSRVESNKNSPQEPDLIETCTLHSIRKVDVLKKSKSLDNISILRKGVLDNPLSMKNKDNKSTQRHCFSGIPVEEINESKHIADIDSSPGFLKHENFKIVDQLCEFPNKTKQNVISNEKCSKTDTSCENYKKEKKQKIILNEKSSKTDTSCENYKKEKKQKIILNEKCSKTDTSCENFEKEKKQKVVSNEKSSKTDTSCENFKKEKKQEVISNEKCSKTDTSCENFKKQKKQNVISNERSSKTDTSCGNFKKERKQKIILNEKSSKTDTSCENYKKEKKQEVVSNEKCSKTDTSCKNFEKEKKQKVVSNEKCLKADTSCKNFKNEKKQEIISKEKCSKTDTSCENFEKEKKQKVVSNEKCSKTDTSCEYFEKEKIISLKNRKLQSQYKNFENPKKHGHNSLKDSNILQKQETEKKVKNSKLFRRQENIDITSKSKYSTKTGGPSREKAHIKHIQSQSDSLKEKDMAIAISNCRYITHSISASLESKSHQYVSKTQPKTRSIESKNPVYDVKEQEKESLVIGLTKNNCISNEKDHSEQEHNTLSDDSSDWILVSKKCIPFKKPIEKFIIKQNKRFRKLSSEIELNPDKNKPIDIAKTAISESSCATSNGAIPKHEKGSLVNLNNLDNEFLNNHNLLEMSQHKEPGSDFNHFLEPKIHKTKQDIDILHRPDFSTCKENFPHFGSGLKYSIIYRKDVVDNKDEKIHDIKSEYIEKSTIHKNKSINSVSVTNNYDDLYHGCSQNRDKSASNTTNKLKKNLKELPTLNSEPIQPHVFEKSITFDHENGSTSKKNKCNLQPSQSSHLSKKDENSNIEHKNEIKKPSSDIRQNLERTLKNMENLKKAFTEIIPFQIGYLNELQNSLKENINEIKIEKTNMYQELQKFDCVYSQFIDLCDESWTVCDSQKMKTPIYSNQHQQTHDSHCCSQACSDDLMKLEDHTTDFFQNISVDSENQKTVINKQFENFDCFHTKDHNNINFQEERVPNLEPQIYEEFDFVDEVKSDTLNPSIQTDANTHPVVVEDLSNYNTGQEFYYQPLQYLTPIFYNYSTPMFNNYSTQMFNNYSTQMFNNYSTQMFNNYSTPMFNNYSTQMFNNYSTQMFNNCSVIFLPIYMNHCSFISYSVPYIWIPAIYNPHFHNDLETNTNSEHHA